METPLFPISLKEGFWGDTWQGGAEVRVPHQAGDAQRAANGTLAGARRSWGGSGRAGPGLEAVDGRLEGSAEPSGPPTPAHCHRGPAKSHPRRSPGSAPLGPACGSATAATALPAPTLEAPADDVTAPRPGARDPGTRGLPLPRSARSAPSLFTETSKRLARSASVPPATLPRERTSQGSVTHPF